MWSMRRRSRLMSIWQEKNKKMAGDGKIWQGMLQQE